MPPFILLLCVIAIAIADPIPIDNIQHTPVPILKRQTCAPDLLVSESTPDPLDAEWTIEQAPEPKSGITRRIQESGRALAWGNYLVSRIYVQNQKEDSLALKFIPSARVYALYESSALQACAFGFSVPENATIVAIEALVKFRADGGPAFEKTVSVILGSSNSGSQKALSLNHVAGAGAGASTGTNAYAYATSHSEEKDPREIGPQSFDTTWRVSLASNAAGAGYYNSKEMRAAPPKSAFTGSGAGASTSTNTNAKESTEKTVASIPSDMQIYPSDVNARNFGLQFKIGAQHRDVNVAIEHISVTVEYVSLDSQIEKGSIPTESSNPIFGKDSILALASFTGSFVIFCIFMCVTAACFFRYKDRKETVESKRVLHGKMNVTEEGSAQLTFLEEMQPMGPENLHDHNIDSHIIIGDLITTAPRGAQSLRDIFKGEIKEQDVKIIQVTNVIADQKKRTKTETERPYAKIESEKSRTVACKCISGQLADQETIREPLLLNELKVLKKLKALPAKDKQHIVEFIGTQINKVAQGPPAVFVVTEFAPLGNLKLYLKAMQRKSVLPPYKERIGFLLDIAHGLRFLHEYGFVHGNLRAAHALVFCSLPSSQPNSAKLNPEEDRPRLKLSGFSCTRFTTDSPDPLLIGNASPWMAPESKERGIRVTDSDMYSYAMVLAEIFLQGADPAPDYSDFGAVNILAKKTPLNVISLFRDLIKETWQVRPSAKMCVKYFDEILYDICHPVHSQSTQADEKEWKSQPLFGGNSISAEKEKNKNL